MLSFESFIHYLGLDGLVSLFKGGANSKDRVSSDAVAAFDGLSSDYREVVRVPVTRDGQLFYRRTSVAELGIIDHEQRDTAERDMRAVLSELLAAGVFTTSKDWTRLPFPRTAYPYSGVESASSARHDSRLTDPLRFFERPARLRGFAANGGLCGYNPSQFPANEWPFPAHVTPLYITPKAITDRDGVTDNAILSWTGRLVDALTRYAKGSNFNVNKHPLTLALYDPMEFPGDTIPPTVGVFAEQVQWLKNERGQGWENYWIRVDDRMVRMPVVGSDPANAEITLVASQGVLNGLRQRVKAGVACENVGDHGDATWSDPMMEFARLVQVCSAVLEIGDTHNGVQSPLVHLHAACKVDNLTRRLAYTQLHLSQGSNVYTYVNALNREEQARKNKAVQNALAVATMSSMTSGSDSMAGGTIATVELALTVAGPVGAVVAVVVIGVAALIAYLTTDTHVDRPDLYTLRDTGNNCFVGLDAVHSITDGPTIRWRVQT